MDCSLGFNLTLHFDTNDRPVWLIIPSTFIPLGRPVLTWLTFFQLTSALCMIAVSIDRAILIYLSRPLTRNQAWGVCVGIWILSYTITIPTLIHSKVHNQNKYKEQVISRDPQWSEIFPEETSIIRIDVIPKKSYRFLLVNDDFLRYPAA